MLKTLRELNRRMTEEDLADQMNFRKRNHSMLQEYEILCSEATLLRQTQLIFRAILWLLKPADEVKTFLLALFPPLSHP